MTPPPSTNSAPTPTPKKTTERCPCCPKKLGLLDLSCRCGTRFCSAHRLPEAHACKHDYRADHRAALTAQLERVAGDKVQKI